MSWLDCNAEKEGGKKVVAKLKCKVCTEFVDKIRGRKNFSEKWIVGADSVRISNVRDHAKNDQHAHAMTLLKQQQSQSAGLGPSSYAPIAQAFTKLSDDEREKLRVKFDIAYFVATENLPYTKYPKICELEARHGVRVGMSYVNENAGKEFIHYITESRRQELTQTLDNAKFFSLLLRTSNIDNEVLLVVWCDRNGSDEKVHTRMEYFTVVRPQSVTAQGLFQVLESGLRGLGIQESRPSSVKGLSA